MNKFRRLAMCFFIMAAYAASPQRTASAETIWSAIKATPTDGFVRVDSKEGKFPTIANIAPPDMKGATISVDTNLSAVNPNKNSNQEDQKAQIATDPVLVLAQTILDTLDPTRTKTVLDATVTLLDAIVKGSPTGTISSASFSAVVDSDLLINRISLSFAALIVTQERCVFISCSDSFGEIGALATFNGIDIPIEFEVLNGELEGNPLKVGTDSSTLDLQLIRGLGSVRVPRTHRGILSISPVALSATEDYGFAGLGPDIFSAVALTNWTATVGVPSPSTVVLLGVGLVGIVLLHRRRRTLVEQNHVMDSAKPLRELGHGRSMARWGRWNHSQEHGAKQSVSSRQPPRKCGVQAAHTFRGGFACSLSMVPRPQPFPTCTP